MKEEEEEVEDTEREDCWRVASRSSMDPEIWSRLPEHLLERVLSFLPLKTFLALRSTCKHFNSLLYSPSFTHSISSSSSSFILLAHPQSLRSCPLYNTVGNSWSTDLPLSFPACSTDLLSSSSSNGLLCFSLLNSSCFLVCNLLRRSLRRVNFPARPFHFEFLTLISTSDGGYKLFALSAKGSSNNALIYDSNRASWRRFPGFNPTLSENYHQKGVHYNGRLFFTTPEPFQVVCFDLESCRWETSAARLPDERLTFVRLVSDEDRKLYLIGGVGATGISRIIKVWEMMITEEGGGEGWTEVETLPEMVSRKFLSVCYHNYEHVYCFWHVGLICVCCYTWPEVLYYKVSRRSWHWLPKPPSLPHKWSCGFRWFSFNPQLSPTP
ncbi:F-box/kelch-repeat protein At5g43190 [Andrographis paniculata]|uniref:F-box/kelch-repeat protein At5g43190 n=1 Tax=Andrographis paniculata TaxID=175694 RepID=UPI0021E77F60|nr:F-box/kelch-repeat protein At5g43190 [Andrographis paniculata]